METLGERSVNIEFDRDLAPSAEYANFVTFNRVGKEFLMEMSYIDTVKMIEVFKSIEEKKDESYIPNVNAKIISRIVMSQEGYERFKKRFNEFQEKVDKHLPKEQTDVI